MTSTMIKNNLTLFFLVLSKLKEWIEFPDKLLQDPSISFEPLLLTIQGAGGTGKSHLIKIIVSVVEQLMTDITVSATCAPTGCAAHGIGGKTDTVTFQLMLMMLQSYHQ